MRFPNLPSQNPTSTVDLAAFIAGQQPALKPPTAAVGQASSLKPFLATKATAIYGMHSYHQGKKPHGAIQHYIRHFTQPGELIFDPFCGSGSTPLAALLEGRAAAALDRSPAAVFIANQHCRPPDAAATARGWAALIAAVQPELDWLYATRCDRCDGPARTCHTVYSERVACPECGQTSLLFDCSTAQGKTKSGRAKSVTACPRCLKRGRTVDIRGGQRLGAEPVLAAYRCLGGCQPAVAERGHSDTGRKRRRYFHDFDLAKIAEIDASPIPHWHPTSAFPATFARWRTDLRLAGVERVDQLYTRRNLWALAAIRAQAVASGCAPSAMFALTAVALAASRMQRYSPRSGFPNMLLVGTYYLPPVGREVAVGDWYAGKLRALARGYQAIRREMPRETNVCIATGDARRLEIPDRSIDYIFTDPPYAGAVQYGELNYVWEAWLGSDDAWHADEIVVSRGRGKDEAAWAADLRQALAECHRVLKPGRWLSLCYHDASAARWSLVQDAIAAAGFAADSTTSSAIETNQSSFNQVMTDKANKRDLVLSFQKPLKGRRRAVKSPASVSNDVDSLARALVCDYLAEHPGTTKDRIFDYVVGRLVSRGQMAHYDFEAVLRSVAQPQAARGKNGRSQRWRLIF